MKFVINKQNFMCRKRKVWLSKDKFLLMHFFVKYLYDCGEVTLLQNNLTQHRTNLHNLSHVYDLVSVRQ